MKVNYNLHSRILIKSMSKLWRIWAKALGDKSGKNDREADYVAMIRTFIFLQLIVTNCFIVGGNIRHWNDHHTPPSYIMNNE